MTLAEGIALTAWEHQAKLALWAQRQGLWGAMVIHAEAALRARNKFLHGIAAGPRYPWVLPPT